MRTIARDQWYRSKTLASNFITIKNVYNNWEDHVLSLTSIHFLDILLFSEAGF